MKNMKYQSKYAKYLKSVRLQFLIYVDLEVLVKKNTRVYNNPEIIYNKRKQTTESNYLISAICAFDDKQNKNDKYGGQDCMQKFCKDLKKH